jgi:hypothetical protein
MKRKTIHEMTRKAGRNFSFNCFDRFGGLILLLLCAFTIQAQETQCSLKLSDLPAAPELMGFRPGMNTDQVKTRIPQVQFGKADDFGVSKTSINPDFDSRIDKSTFPGVRTVSLDFLDGKLTSLWLGYDGTFKWATVPDFVKGISQSMHLPDAWTTWRTRGQQLRCSDFTMTVIIVAEGPSFRIIDETAEQTVVARREAKENEADEEDSPQEILGDRKTRLYYPVGCQAVKEVKDADRITFSTVADAEQAGYKAAKNCPR